MAGVPTDWQLRCIEVKQRGEYLLNSGQWSDCTFLVGAEPDQVVIAGHKLILAMASPVFEAMFYGGMAERNDPIPILDIQPEAFRALVEYIYTDNINISSFDKACGLYYGAKKYMLPHLVKECTRYIWSDLEPRNACRAYELARLFEENVLMEKCLKVIRSKTEEVLTDSSFEDAELNTVLTVLSQDCMNTNNEVLLFEAVDRYAEALSKRTSERNISSLSESGPPNENSPGSLTSKDKVVNVDSSAENSPEAVMDTQKASESSDQPLPGPSDEGKKKPDSKSDKPTIRTAIEKIRFLTLTPQQFAEGPARSSLLTASEAFAVLMNIASSSSDVAMPSGFSTCRAPRKQPSSYLACLDTEMEDDQARSETTFRFTVQNIRNLQRYVWSPACFVRNLPWKIKVMQRQTSRRQKSLGFFLQCNGESESSSWSCYAQAELRLISHKPETEPFFRKIQHLFYSKEDDWGFADFMTWNDVLDPEKGYIKDGAITLEVHLTADAPHGVS